MNQELKTKIESIANHIINSLYVAKEEVKPIIKDITVHHVLPVAQSGLQHTANALDKVTIQIDKAAYRIEQKQDNYAKHEEVNPILENQVGSQQVLGSSVWKKNSLEWADELDKVKPITKEVNVTANKGVSILKNVAFAAGIITAAIPVLQQILRNRHK